MTTDTNTGKPYSLPEIPSEFIEPYLTKFMGNIIEFAANAVTQEEKERRGGSGFTITEIRQWVKGLELFVQWNCAIHARYAMSNEFYQRWCFMTDEQIQTLCRQVMEESLSEC